MFRKRVQVFRPPKTFDRLSRGGGTTKNLPYGGVLLLRYLLIGDILSIFENIEKK